MGAQSAACFKIFLKVNFDEGNEFLKQGYTVVKAPLPECGYVYFWYAAARL